MRLIPLVLLALFSLFPVFASAQQQQILCATNTPCGPTGPTNTLTGDQAPVAGYKINTNFTSLFNSVALLSVEYNVQNTAYAGGADPTGSADSTAAIQAAMTAACTVGGILKFPHGTYKVSSTLNGCNTAPFWMSIEGDAEYKTYINWAGATPTLSNVTITGTAGQFGCTCTGLAVGQTLTLSGTYGGTGSISGYVNATTYRIVATNGTSTFTLQSLLNQAALVTTAGTPTGITYTPGVSVFYMVGWGSSTIRNITLNLGSNTGVTGWNLDLNSTVQSSENLTFTNDLVQGTGVNMVGWRLGETSAGGNDFSFINWENCAVHGNLPSSTVEAGSYGWLITSANALDLNWFGGNAYYLASGFSNVRPTNGGYAGNGSDYFYGFGTSHNTTDFTLASGTQYGIYGGRFEEGTTFLDVIGYLAYTQIIVSGVEISGYPYNGVLFNLVGSVNLDLEGSHIEGPVGGSSYTNSLITAYTDSGPVFQTINLRNNLVLGPVPYWSSSGTNVGGSTRFKIEGGLAQATSGSGAASLMQDTVNTVAAVSTTGGTTNLTTSQVGNPVVEVSGALTSNATVVFPASSAWSGTLVNATTGAYTVTFQTSGQVAAGTVVAQTGATPAASDGTTLYSINSASNTWTGAQTFNANVGITGTLALTGSLNVSGGTISGAVYTVATLPTCTSGIVGALASVNNGVTSPTYFGAVSTTGTATDPVYCNYNGSTYGWVYH